MLASMNRCASPTPGCGGKLDCSCSRVTVSAAADRVAVEKRKAEALLMDNDKKREKNRREVGRLEKDLGDSAKELQTMATPSKLMIAFLVMAIMFGVNRRWSNARDCLSPRGNYT